jgi:hypothetical protein
MISSSKFDPKFELEMGLWQDPTWHLKYVAVASVDVWSNRTCGNLMTSTNGCLSFLTPNSDWCLNLLTKENGEKAIYRFSHGNNLSPFLLFQVKKNESSVCIWQLGPFRGKTIWQLGYLAEVQKFFAH